MTFLEKLESVVREKTDRIILADERTKGISYGQLYEISGRVYRYLKERGIGREDFVLLCLPRGVQVPIAIYGILRAGAAFVVTEDTYAPERVEYIRKDCGCKLVIDSHVWQEIQHAETLAGYEPVDDHAAAFAVYTSGTTGNPKGVLHEYGNLSRMADSIARKTESTPPVVCESDSFALVAPLNFIASMIVLMACFDVGFRMTIVPYAVVKNPTRMGMYLIKNESTVMFLPPSYLRNVKQLPPKLKMVATGSEIASDLYLDGVTIQNCYSMSETGFVAARFVIDKKYEVTPIGRSPLGEEILLLDEDGNPVPEGEEGEICFLNPYVRGYIHLPEETAAAFRGGYFHTGDLGQFDENGNLVLKGRLNDMVKINGNRVEPAEIEAVGRKVLGLDWAGVRAFTENGKSYLCLYYLEDRKIDEADALQKMDQYLPYYMLPSFFLKIDEIPLRPSGKMDRKALPAPVFENYRSDYKPPVNEIQEALCRAFEAVLKFDRIGITDDFYLLGGDSLGTMELLVKSGLKSLNASDVFRGRTPEKIAEIYQKNRRDKEDVDIDAQNEAALKKELPLTTGQIYMVDYQLYTPKSTMFNLYRMLKFDASVVSGEALARAVNAVICNHPALLSVFTFNLDGELVQHYVPERFEPIVPEKVTEAEFEKLKDTLVQPYKIVNSLLYRARVFETEKQVYFFFDVHHTVFDGTSVGIFFGDLLKAFRGEPLEKDYYYLLVEKKSEQVHSPEYLESKAYFENRYGGEDWSCYPREDKSSRETEIGDIDRVLPFSPAMVEQATARMGVSKNEFFLTVSMLSIALYNDCDKVKISWIYNGRENKAGMHSAGLLFDDLPVALKVTEQSTVEELFESVKEQVNLAIAHSAYPYIEKDSRAVLDDVACLLYQGSMRELDAEGLPVEEVEIRQNKAASQTVLDIEILDSEEGLELYLDYSASRYEKSSMENYADLYEKLVTLLLAADAPKRTFGELREQTEKETHKIRETEGGDQE